MHKPSSEVLSNMTNVFHTYAEDACAECLVLEFSLQEKYTHLQVEVNVQNNWLEQSERTTPCLQGECDEPLSHQHVFHSLGFILNICPTHY